jgi:LacI family transcriptional regulator, galactose operon repressor
VVTLQDIAKATGKTVSTVSYALSGRGSISEATRARIVQCAQELGYQPNLVARSLVTQRTSTIGLIVTDIANPFYGEVAQAVERAANPAGYRVLFVSSDRDDALSRGLLEDLVARRVDGIIAMPGGLSVATIRGVVPVDRPVVWCLWEEESQALTRAVGVNFVTGGRLVAEHLTGLGHRRAAIVVQGPERNGTSTGHGARLQGYRHGLALAGWPLDETLIGLGNSTIESGYTAALALLDLPVPPTAIFATNDLMAAGVLAAARARGLQVPRDLSVVGFDDIVTAAHFGPPLTTVRIDKVALMTVATELLLAAIAGEALTPPPLFVPTLVVRESTRSL